MELTWYEKIAIKLGLSVAEQRSPEVKKIISELSSPALWACLATAVPLVVQLFTSIGNPHLAAIGGSIMAVYAIAVQLKDAFLHVPPPGKDTSNTATSVAVASAATATAAQSVQASAAHLEQMHSKVLDTIAMAESLLNAATDKPSQSDSPAATETESSAPTFDAPLPPGAGL